LNPLQALLKQQKIIMAHLYWLNMGRKKYLFYSNHRFFINLFKVTFSPDEILPLDSNVPAVTDVFC
jgi:hypothetical protein